MADEGDFIALMRALAGTRAARDLIDDVAVLDTGPGPLILTTDTLVEGVHYRADDPADSIGWKLAAVNLSDLAAKGAQPVGCLVNYALSGDARWDADFARGLGEALRLYAMPLLGGDTVAMPQGAPRSLSLTALGRSAGPVPSRSGARLGDALYLSGPVGDAGLGLQLLDTGKNTPAEAIEAYRRPKPRMTVGQLLAPLAHATMDISDGLLIDAARMAQASGVGIVLTDVPVSSAYAATIGDDTSALISAATSGDDYELLLAMPADWVPPVEPKLIRVGTVVTGEGVSLVLRGQIVPLPERLGWVHGAGANGK